MKRYLFCLFRSRSVPFRAPASRRQSTPLVPRAGGTPALRGDCTFTLFLICLSVSTVKAELVCERWGAEQGPYRYPNTVKLEKKDKARRLVVHLSALPRETVIHHASLFCFTANHRQPLDPIQIRAADALLKLEAPGYCSFDMTEAVRGWVRNPESNQGLTIESFDNWDVGRTFVEIRYEGTSKDVPPQVEGLKALHHDGQTFLVWKEIPAFRPPAEVVVWAEELPSLAYNLKDKIAKEPGEGFGGVPRLPAITKKDLFALQGRTWNPSLAASKKKGGFEKVRDIPDVRYRIYYSPREITTANLCEAQLLGEVTALCGYNDELPHQESPDSLVPTLRVAADTPIMPGEAYYVHTPAEKRSGFYAVTNLQIGVENTAVLSPANSLQVPVEEIPAVPKPILQFSSPGDTRTYRTESRSPIREATASLYAYWAAPPYCNLPRQKPQMIGVTIPNKIEKPMPVMICDGRPGSSAGRTFMTVSFESLIPFGEDLCFSEGYGTLRSFKECKADYYSERYILSLTEWALKVLPIDRSRSIWCTSAYFAVRHPEIFRRAYIGPFGMAVDMKWGRTGSMLAAMLGPAETAVTVDGKKAWDAFDLNCFFKEHPAWQGPVFYCHTLGKESGDTAEFGWRECPRGMAYLHQNRQPLIACWGALEGTNISQEVHNFFFETLQPLGKTSPVFTHSSIDNNPGGGDPDEGDPGGTINGYLLWDVTDGVDQADRWEITAFIVPSHSDQVCSVNITPHFCNVFKPKPGEKFRWINTALSDGKEVQNGEIAADAAGRVTLPEVVVTKGKNRIQIFK